MVLEWTEITLGELIDIRHGFAFKGQFIHDEPNGHVLLTPGNFAIGGGFKGDKLKYYNGVVPEEFILHKGDVIVTMTDLSKQSDTLGYPAFVPACNEGRRYLHNQRIGKITLKDIASTDARYIYYVMCSTECRNEVLASATGTTIKHTSPDRIKRFRFSLPPLQEQRTIAHILGTLDDKIELNRRMNETLEASARALFKSWFVDFDPVRAKMEGRDTGLPQDIADLFPDRLVDSELGKIPKGWKVGCVSDVCKSIENGGTPKRTLREYWNGDVKWFKTSELVDEPLLNSSEHITNLGLRNSSCKLWPAGTVLIALYASPTVGRLGILEVSAAANQACCGLIVEPEFGKLFLFYLLFFGRRYFQNIAVGSAQQNISQQIVRNYQIVIPAAKISREFDSLVEAIYLQRVAKHSESRTLAVLRDILLPKLISGEIRVHAAEKAVESVT